MPRKEPRELVELDYVRMNIGGRYWQASLESMFDDALHKPMIERYCKGIHRVRRKGMGLLLWGDNSRGKTYATAVILKTAVAYGFSGYCVLADQLKAAIIEKTVFEQPGLDGAVKTVWERVLEVDFLVIEDIGKEYSGQSGFVETQFENLMRHRTRNLMPTLITTNLTLKEYKTRYAKSAFEITKECLFPYQVKGRGGSFRDGAARDLGRRLR